MSNEPTLDDAVRVHRQGRLDEAERIYCDILEREPFSTDALIIRAVSLERNGRRYEAIRLYEDGIRRAPCLAFYVNLGALWISEKRPDCAIAPLQKAVELAPACVPAHVNLAGAYSMLGNNAEALASYRKAFELEPENPETLTRLSAFLDMLGAFGAAATKRARDAALTSVVTTFATTGAAPRRLVYEGRHIAPADLASVERKIEKLPAGPLARPDSLRPPSGPAPGRAADEGRETALLDAASSFPILRSIGTSPNGGVTADGKGSVPAALRPHPSPLPTGEGTRRIAFVSPHCVMDFASGAATATRGGLAILAAQGFTCEAFCGTRADGTRSVPATLAKHHAERNEYDAQIGPFQGRMIFTGISTRHGNIPVTMVDTDAATALTPGPSPGSKQPSPWPSPRGRREIAREEIAAFLTGCELFLDRFRPDVVWTYGGDPAARVVQQMARQRGITVVFALHNFAYADRAAFALVDHVTVPSEFSRRHYRDKLGLECHVLPNVVDADRVKSKEQGAGSKECDAGGSTAHASSPMLLASGPLLPAPCSPLPARYVTFVNPSPLKGAFVFARIAEVLSRRRPDIPLLVVEGANKAGLLPKLAIDLGGLKNVRIMPSTPDPRTFYAVSKLLLMPSLIESAGLVAMEAMTNGIPVLASTRGALPETIGGSPHPGPLPEGEGGFLFDIPARYTPETRNLPTAEEVAPWVETIIRLWEDAAEYGRASRAARERGQRWHPDCLAPLYRDFFQRAAASRDSPVLAD